MHHIHRRNVCDHGYEGKPCHPGNHKDVGHAECSETACPSITMERHAVRQHKDGGCTCGFPVRSRVHHD